MNKKFIISLILIGAVLISSLAVPSTAAEVTGTVTGEVSRTTSQITLSDGTDTGVTHTQIYLNGYYGNNRVINIAEGDLSNQNLSIDFINSGSYMVSSRPLTTAVSDYNSKHSDKQVLAAVNGDLYMTSIHSNSNVTKKVLGVPRGVLIVDGEIWASAQIDQENYGATNDEKNTPAGHKPAFGVTYLNQPVIGTPLISTTVEIDGVQLEADGINRLPALDALILYNYRCYSTNYALDDSYEVELEVNDSSAFKAGGTITGTIINIYKSGSTTRPSFKSNTVVLTARGNRIADLEAACAIGKTVTLKTELTDYYGRTELWQNVRDAVGGHMRVLRDGDGAPFTSSTYYPTTLIGYKDNGNVALVTVTSTLDNSRAALKISQSYELCKELGFNTVFYLDGGGSTTFVTLDEGSYTVRNKCSDGSQRYIMGGIGFVWNEDPVCMRQGNLYHINVFPDENSISPVHVDGALMERIIVGKTDVDTSYSTENNALQLLVNKDTEDPNISFDYTKLQSVNAEDYPYVLIKLRTTAEASKVLALYYSCGEYTDSAADRIKTRSVSPSDDWQYISLNLSKDTLWNGSVNNLRIDPFNEAVSEGESMEIASITLCKSSQDIANVRKGILPEGCSQSYRELLDSLKPTPYFITGDIREDGRINSADSFMLKTYMIGVTAFSNSQKYAADINGSGTVNAADSLHLKYYITNGKWKY